MRDKRGSASSRGYTSRWQKARATYLLSHPLCVIHQRSGRDVAATVVDHVIPHKGDQELFWNEDNWQSLCKTCHDSFKQAEERGHLITGCDAKGQPLDPRHHWYRPE